MPCTVKSFEFKTSRRCFRMIRFHSTTFVIPVSSSSVTNMTPLAVPGRCRHVTMPVVRTSRPVGWSDSSIAERRFILVSFGRSSARGCLRRVSLVLA